MQQNKKALISGAGSGIGYEIAKKLAQRGYHLLLVSRNGKKLQSIKEDFRQKFNVEVEYMECDMSVPGAAKRIFAHFEAVLPEIEILVNNAGFGNYGEHTEIALDDNYRMLQLNVISLTEMCSLFGKAMKERKTGMILNVASTAAYQPTPYFAAYGASKSYVLNFSEAIAKELEDYNVSVTCLSPGPTDTNFFKAAQIENLKNSLLNDRMSTEEVAETGVNALFHKKLSVIPGLKSKILVFANRLISRAQSAKISKMLLASEK